MMTKDAQGSAGKAPWIFKLSTRWQLSPFRL